MNKSLEFSIKNRIYFLALLIFIINLSVSMYRIGVSAFWFDEIISVKDTLLNFGHIKHESEWDANPPFYYYILWLWSKLFGISEVGIRSLSAVFTSLSSMLMFIWLNRYTKIKIAFLGTLMFVFHPFMYYYSQEARCYGLLVFLVMINLFAFQKYYENQSFLNIMILGILNFLLVYTHYLAGFLMIPQGIYLLWKTKTNFFKTGIYLYLIPLILIFWRFTPKQFDYLLNSKKALRVQNSIQLANLSELLHVIKSLFINEWFGFIILIGFLYYFFKITYKEPVHKDSKSFIIGYILFSSVITLFILYFVGKITLVFSARYLLFVLPFLALGFVLILSQFNLRIYWVISILLVGIEIYKIEPGKSRNMDYRVCANVIKKLDYRNDIIFLVQTKDMKPLMVYYYDRELFKQSPQFSDNILSEKSIYFFNKTDEINGIDFSGKNACVLIQTFENKLENQKLLKLIQNKTHQLKIGFSSNTLEGIRLSMF